MMRNYSARLDMFKKNSLISSATTCAFMLACSFASPANAATVVCIDLAGKKIFSDIPCEKRGLKASIADFPVLSAGSSGSNQTAQIVQPIFILTTPSEGDVAQGQGAELAKPAQAAQKAVPYTRPNIWNEPLKINPVAMVILGVMPIAASGILGHGIFMYFRRRKLRLQDLQAPGARIS
jgi:hypothetical protein